MFQQYLLDQPISSFHRIAHSANFVKFIFESECQHTICQFHIFVSANLLLTQLNKRNSPITRYPFCIFCVFRYINTMDSLASESILIVTPPHQRLPAMPRTPKKPHRQTGRVRVNRRLFDEVHIQIFVRPFYLFIVIQADEEKDSIAD